jgi:hypothetical protein
MYKCDPAQKYLIRMVRCLLDVTTSIDGRSGWYTATEKRLIESASPVATHSSANSHGKQTPHD